eukprot:jgi/Galph1/5044/GphlegSOOS_G58.1
MDLLERNKRGILRGYIAMLAVRREFRRLGIGMELVKRVMEEMKQRYCEEICLETEVNNYAALGLYRN